MTLDDDTRSDFLYWIRTQGYFVLPGAVSDPHLLGRLRDAVDAAVRSGEGGNFSDIAHLVVNADTAFLELLDEPGPIELIELVLGKSCIIHSYNCVSLRPSKANNASQIHKDSPRFSVDYVHAMQVLWFIDDFTSENGATWFLPGSHRSPDRPSDRQFEKRAVQVEGPAGTAVLFDSGLWHRGGTNTSEGVRRGATLVLSRPFMKQQIDLPRAVSPDIVSAADHRRRRLLGFDARVPASMEEFNLPIEQRLYRPGQE